MVYTSVGDHACMTGVHALYMTSVGGDIKACI